VHRFSNCDNDYDHDYDNDNDNDNDCVQPQSRAQSSMASMTTNSTTATEDAAPDADAVPELELADADILDAMRHIPGYLDITTADFRIIYHLAHAHAVARLFHGLTAGRLMRTGITGLPPATPLGAAARSFVEQGVKTLPVIDPDGRVLGVLTETDVLRQLGAASFLELLLQLLDGDGTLGDRGQDTATSAMMTTPAVTVTEHAGLREIMTAFRRHAGRGMPVVDAQGRCSGLLLRKDFLTACHLDESQ
jgi:CBS-domain-containing membrane protein